MPTITVIGSLNMDLVVYTPRFPDAGETITGYGLHTIPGGKGANQAVAIARQGVRVLMVGRLGRDEFGERILAALGAEQIDTGRLEIVPEVTTGVAIIAVDDRGENRIILAPGANHSFTLGDIELTETALAQSDALVMQLEIPLPVVTYAARLAKERGVLVILNAAPARQLPDEVASNVDYLVVNAIEASLLTQCAPTEPREAACKLITQGFGNVIITLGADGVLFANNEHMEVVPGFSMSVVDTTAAGDAFIGAFASALTRGKEVRDAVIWANAAGALATTVLGAQPSLPTYLAVEEFLGKHDGQRPGGGGPLHR